MSPTSYQTAPPRSSIINNDSYLVKLAAAELHVCRFTPAILWAAVTVAFGTNLSSIEMVEATDAPHPTPVSGHRTIARVCELQSRLRSSEEKN
jgi:hypothetical protein